MGAVTGGGAHLGREMLCPLAGGGPGDLVRSDCLELGTHTHSTNQCRETRASEVYEADLTVLLYSSFSRCHPWGKLGKGYVGTLY